MRNQYYSTKDVSPEERIGYWNKVYRRFAQVTFTPADNVDFGAELQLGALGLVDFARLRIGPSEVERSREHVRGEPERRLAFILLLGGEAEFTHYGRTSKLTPGDIVLCDNTEPSYCRYDGPAVSVVARTSAAALSARLPHFDRHCGRRLRSGFGLADTAFALTHSLSLTLERGLPLDAGRAASIHLLDVLTTAYALAFGEEIDEHSASAARLDQVLNHIESNLRDATLSPQSIADAMRISRRYLRYIMAEAGELPAAYVMRRRLEECAKELAASQRRTVSDIAASWGFKNNAHFSRVFKAEFGMSPRDYRHMLA